MRTSNINTVAGSISMQRYDNFENYDKVSERKLLWNQLLICYILRKKS